MTRVSLALVIVAALAAPALADTAPPPAAAAPPPAPPTANVQLDVLDAGSSTATFTGTLAISGGDCGVLEASTVSGHYHVRMCFDTQHGTPALLALDLDRDVGRGKDSVHQKVQTTARLEAGKRIVLGRFGQGTDTTEIAATIK